MERKNRIHAMMAPRGPRAAVPLVIGVILGLGASAGGVALYYTGYQSGLAAAKTTPADPQKAQIPASLLELPPPFEEQEGVRQATYKKETDNHRSKSF